VIPCFNVCSIPVRRALVFGRPRQIRYVFNWDGVREESGGSRLECERTGG
jgi:predicted Fe-S protein YdhL (DUF1289 family)